MASKVVSILVLAFLLLAAVAVPVVRALCHILHSALFVYGQSLADH